MPLSTRHALAENRTRKIERITKVVSKLRDTLNCRERDAMILQNHASGFGFARAL